MTDIFISYSRKDIAFARLLHDALKDNGFVAWIDWQDIPPSTDWLKEVYTAIEQSDTFIFILSSSSSVSDICMREIEHAKKNNKRLIPIMINEVEPSAVHPVLAALNWIFSRTKDEFQPAISDLITAIQTDFDWVKAHTRLQVRALEWERANYDKSFLLRGSDLNQAEEWFSKAAQKSPEPTLLQTQYLQTSRQEAVKRQRSLLVGVAAALIITVVLGVMAFINGQRAKANAVSLSTQVVVARDAEATAQQEAFFRATQQTIAEEQKVIAEEQRDAAVSRQLAAEALNIADINFSLALLLSLEANRYAKGELWAKGTLLEVMQRKPHLLTFINGHQDSVNSVAINPLGNILASGSDEKLVILWDISNPKVPKQMGLPLSGHTEYIESVLFNPGGDILVSGSEKEVIFWDVSDPFSPSQIGQLSKVGVKGAHSLSINADGRILATGNQSRVILWDVSDFGSPQELSRPDLVETRSYVGVRNLQFSPDGQLLAAVSGDEILMWDVSSPARPRILGKPLAGHSNSVHGIDFSPNGEILATGAYDNAILLWDISDPEDVHQIGDKFVGHSGPVLSLAFNQEGTILSSGSYDTTIVLWDVRNPNSPVQIEVPLSGHFDWVNSIAFSPAGNLLASGSLDHSIILWEIDAPETPIQIGIPINVLENDINSLAFHPNGRILATGIGNTLASESQQSVILLDLSLPDKPAQISQPLSTGESGSSAALVAFSSDGQLMATGGRYDDIILWDVSDLASPDRIGQPLPDSHATVANLQFSPDGHLIAAVNEVDRQVILWDISTPNSPYQISRLFTRYPATVEQIDFSPDGSILAVTLQNSTVVLWDINDPSSPVQIGEPIQGHTDLIFAAGFNPTKPILALGGVSQTQSVLGNSIVLLDISKPEEASQISQPLIGHKSSISCLAFSPDGNILASGSEDNTIILWNISIPEMPQQIGQPLTGHNEYIESLVFSPDGRLLVSGGDDHTILIWNLDLESWKNQACNIAGRNMTQGEWEQYLSLEPYRKTCEQYP